MAENSTDSESPASMLDRHVGKRLYAAREAAGITVAMVARALGTTLDRYLSAERGETRLSPSELVACSELMLVPITCFFSGMAGDALPARDEHPLVWKDNVVAFPGATKAR